MELSLSRGVFAAKQQGNCSMATASPPTGTRTGPTNGGTTQADIEHQLETIRDDISKLTRQMSDLADQTKDTAMAQVKSQVRRAQAAANTAIEDAQATGKEAVDAFREVADTFGDAIDDSLKRRPYATLAIAAGIGFLFGVAWKR
jgi:ElaB/YqjD/DUF883 family membrane-anchored ribosome-binding protein